MQPPSKRPRLAVEEVILAEALTGRCLPIPKERGWAEDTLRLYSSLQLRSFFTSPTGPARQGACRATSLSCQPV